MRILVIFLLLSSSIYASQIIQSLNNSWEFRQVGTDQWMKATVPGTVHTDLLENGKIQDPFNDNNEIELQWIENEDWEYRLLFTVDNDQRKLKHHEINFEGLDTYAQVYFNGTLILEANNMFRSWNVDVSKFIEKGENEIHIIFTSPIVQNKEKVQDYLPLPSGSDTTEFPVGPFTRKAAYHFGWDWAPRFVTCGIWKNVELVSWENFRIVDSYFKVSRIKNDSAFILLNASVVGDKNYPVEVWFGGAHIFDLLANKKPSFGKMEFAIPNPVLWWPNGSGNPELHEFELLYKGADEEFIYQQKLGIRTIELINEPDSIGTSFYFEVNGEPIFMKGANYVPQDVFLPRVDDSQYESLLNQVKSANMNMLRVWGGGVYERDIFYDLCDEYGILVWQDFMFAGSLYPSDPEFISNVKEEVIEQVNRLSKHTCLALWCGNNEVEVAWNNWGWQTQYGYTKEDSIKLWSDYVDLFETGIPAWIKSADNSADYVPTSPQSNWGTAENFNHGSMHYWGVWHGPDDFSGFNQNIGRFMVEYGFQSYPNYSILEEYISPKNLKLNSEIMNNRQKSYVGNSRIVEFIDMYAVDTPDTVFNDFISNSQWTQSLGYRLAISAHLKSQPHCMGSLLWQLNDCWPGPSWSIINYGGVPKQAYWEVKDVFNNE